MNQTYLHYLRGSPAVMTNVEYNDGISCYECLSRSLQVLGSNAS